MNDPCDLCKIVFDEVKLKLAHQKYENNSQKEELMKIGCDLRKLCPDSHIYLYEHLRNKILDKSRALKEGVNRKMKKSFKFVKKGKGRGGPKSSFKPRTNPGQSQWSGARERSKSTNRKSQERTFNRTESKGSLTRNPVGNPGQSIWSSNRDRSKSTNRRISQERGLENKAGRSLSKNKNKNQSRSNSLETIPSELTFSDNLVNKWQTGSDGINTGMDLKWYGPYFKPRSRDSSLTNVRRFSKSPVAKYSDNTFSRKLPGVRDSSTDNRPHYKQSHNDFRTQSLDRFDHNSSSESGNPRLDGRGNKNFNPSFQPHCRTNYHSQFDVSRQQKYSEGNQNPRTLFPSTERHSNPEGFPKENYSYYKSKYSNSFENVSMSQKHCGNRSGSGSRNLSSGRNITHNYHEKNYQRQEKGRDRSSDYKSKQEKYSGSQPTSRDSSAESRASLFLPKFGSRTSVQNISDNEQDL